MMKERVGAIFIGLIMLLSTAGFALTFVIPERKAPEITIPPVVTEPLTREEKLYVLQTGRVLIEHFYPENCSYCGAINSEIESFAKHYSSFIVFEGVESNTTGVFRMIGANGRIMEMGNMTITQETLLDAFCDMSARKPRECLMREI